MDNNETVIITGRMKPRIGLIVSGVILITLGIVLTSISEASAKDLAERTGGYATYTIYWGLVLVGAVNILQFLLLLTDKVKVTNMRVKGSQPGRRFDILLSQINSVVLQSNGSITINSAAGAVTTVSISNAPQVVDAINRLLGDVRGVPVQPQMQQPVQPVMQQPVQPMAQQPVQPMAQQPVQPMAQQPVQPMMQRPVQPMAQRPVQPMMQQPVQPMAQQPVQPMIQQPVQPMMQRPVQPMMQQPVQPVLQRQIPQNVADELKRALDLVNSGAMSVQDYEALKSRLLGGQ